MSIWHRRAIYSAIVGVIATVGFLVAGFAGDGPGELAEDTARRNVAAAFVAFGIFTNLLVRYLTRPRPDDPRGIVDERDRAIHRHAFEIALWVTVSAVFVGCLALYETHQEAGALPVNWIWFLGYGAVLLANLGWSIPALFMYAGVGGRAEG